MTQLPIRKVLVNAILLSLSIIMLTGCAALAPPERPAYTGTDSVTNAQAEQLVGNWSVTQLNPFPDSPPQNVFIEYFADGNVKGQLTITGEQVQAVGDMEFELTGQWILNGDVVTHQNIQMNSTRTDTLGSIISQMVNSQQGISGRANIYELSKNRIVMLGSDGAAMEYIRQ